MGCRIDSAIMSAQVERGGLRALVLRRLLERQRERHWLRAALDGDGGGRVVAHDLGPQVEGDLQALLDVLPVRVVATASGAGFGRPPRKGWVRRVTSRWARG